MLNILNFFTKKLFGASLTTIFLCIMLGVIAAIAVPNYEKILGVFGFQTRAALKEDLASARNNLNTAVAANTVAQNTITVLKGTVANTETVIVKKQTNDNNIKAKSQEIKEKASNKIEKIKTSSVSPEAQEREISSVQISSLWDTYCSFNEHENCKLKTPT